MCSSDIGFVEPGQPAGVKVESLPFTRYGTIDGTVLKVPQGAVDEREASAERSGGRGQTARRECRDPPKGRTLVFRPTIGFSRSDHQFDGKEIPSSAGTRVVIEIRTGARAAP